MKRHAGLTEHGEQCLVIAWARLSEGRFPDLWGLHAIPNGANMGDNDHQRAHHATRQKAEGMKRGVCDLFLPVARHGFHGAYLEMKRDRASKISPEQLEFIEWARSQGYSADRYDGSEAAIAFLEWYLS